MKKLITISFIIFGLLLAGLVIYATVEPVDQKITKSGNQTKPATDANSTEGSSNEDTDSTNQPTQTTLSLAEIAKHSSISDCWILVDGKVYDITAYFGGHPGGDSTMTPTCGQDATAAFYTKDPYADSSSSRSAHSSRATSQLTSYLIGNLNQTINR